MGMKRDDLIGRTGSITRSITVVDATECEDGTVDVRIQDSMGNEYSTELDDDISLD
ncbi:hypothetical protein [Paenibacillus terrae]|uniref:hypothetical protein n=1 Tax=Paenibacillus terrae TaxID=159743 RepID=UPI000A8DCE44|nr:hypothetical protein [Paenibacillus terrae]